MKKQYIFRLLLTLSFGFLFNISNAQIVEQEAKFGKGLQVDANTIKQVKSDKLKNKRVETQWFDYIDDARNFGEDYTYFTGSWMWPDSLPILIFDDGPNNNGMHGGGMTYDPSSSFWSVNANATEWSRHTKYTVDSVLILFKYRNFGKFRDSVVINFFNSPDVVPLTWNSDGSATSSVRYNESTNSMPNATESRVIYLDSSDNTSNFYSTDFDTYTEGGFELAVGMDVESRDPATIPQYGNVFAVTTQFFPQVTAALGDTLKFRETDSTDQDSTNLSLFSLLNMRGNSVTFTDPSQNHGIFVFGSQRYGGDNGATNDNWLYPFNPPNTPNSFNYTLFKITGSNVGINEINDKVSFALSPNPISKNQTLHADFKLTESGNVTIDIVDLTGKVVKQVTNGFYAPGEHLIDVTLADLSNGVYLYQISTDYGVTSKKFVVQ